MARTSVIKQDGTGDYTTIGAWEASIDITTNGLETGEIQDNNTYGAVTFTGFTGTPSSTEYAYLTVAEANRHDGTFSSTCAKIADSPGHVITVVEDYTRFEHLVIRQTGTGNSDECIRNDGNHVLVSRCLLETLTTAATDDNHDQDGIYIDTANKTVYVDHCIFRNFRSAVRIFNVNGCVGHIDHCAGVEHQEMVFGGAGGVSMTFHIYNSFGSSDFIQVGSTVIGDPGAESSDPTYTWNGDRVAVIDTSAESKFTNSYDSITFVSAEPVSGENIWIEDSGTGDYRIHDTNSFTITQNGSSRTPPDSRQDFSTDLTGRSWGALTQIGPNVPTQQASDSTAPTLTNPSTANVGHSTVTGGVETDEAEGTLYWIVDQSNTAPSVAQIQAGQGSDNSAADAFDSQTVNSLGQQEVFVTGLDSDTSYYMYFQQQDTSNNDSTVVETSQFTTLLLGYANTAIESEQSLSISIGLVQVPYVVMQCTDAIGGTISDQANVATWIYTDRDLAPDVTTSNSSIMSGELRVNVDGTLTDGTQVHVIAELENGFMAVGNTIVTEV